MDCAGGFFISLRAFFCCLNQDLQDLQDLQDCLQVREDLNVYRHQQKHDDKVREDLNRCRAFFCCLNQDLQDEQDGQDGGRLGMRRKGLEDLNVYRNQQEREAKVREDLNVSIGCCDACAGQAPTISPSSWPS